MLDKFKIGHQSDDINKTGVTVILADGGAIGGASVRGAAPATRETDLLKPDKTVDRVDAVVLSGGSAFGLEASCGVMDYLFENGAGFSAGKYRVPIVCGASLYDLEYGKFAYPDKSMGYNAAVNAKTDNFDIGSIGAGAGATVGKAMGMSCATKAGIGVATATFGKVEVAVIVAVNALGEVVEAGKILGGVKGDDGFTATIDIIKKRMNIAFNPHMNTTIGCIITNADLDKVQVNHLADLGHDGYAQSIRPCHTLYDGDAMFCLASGEVKADYMTLSAIIPKLTALAVRSSVTK